MEAINVNKLLDKLSDKQKQLLKDTIINGFGEHVIVNL